MENILSYSDIILFAIILIATFLSFIRGFLEEFLHFIIFVGSGVASFFLYLIVSEYLKDLIPNTTMVGFLVFSATFIACVLVLYTLKWVIFPASEYFRRGFIDRFLGIFFGLIKGFVIVSFIHFTLVTFSEEKPKWLEEGKTYKFSEIGSDIIKDFIGEDIAYLRDTKIEKEEEINEDIINKIDGTEELINNIKLNEGIEIIPEIKNTNLERPIEKIEKEIKDIGTEVEKEVLKELDRLYEIEE